MDETEEYYTSRVKKSEDLFWQVGKTVQGKSVGTEQLSLIVEHLKDSLKLKSDDCVIDLGSGNGLITKEIAGFVHGITGVERNKALHTQACKNHPLPNQRFIHEDMLNITWKSVEADKAYCYEVIQHLTHQQVEKFLNRIRDSIPAEMTFLLFLGGIPDEKKKWAFYDTEQRRNMLSRTLIEKGKDPIGTWFHSQFFDYLSQRLNIDYEIIKQPSKLYTAHYRFDCILRF